MGGFLPRSYRCSVHVGSGAIVSLSGASVQPLTAVSFLETLYKKIHNDESDTECVSCDYLSTFRCWKQLLLAWLLSLHWPSHEALVRGVRGRKLSHQVFIGSKDNSSHDPTPLTSFVLFLLRAPYCAFSAMEITARSRLSAFSSVAAAADIVKETVMIWMI